MYVVVGVRAEGPLRIPDFYVTKSFRYCFLCGIFVFIYSYFSPQPLFYLFLHMFICWHEGGGVGGGGGGGV